MRKEIPNLLIRDIEAENLLEVFLVSAVSSVLITRVYLTITGYPQVGAGGIHIAHVLFGGILMAVSVILLLSFLNQRIKDFSSVLGGIGFGLFIDELGKFVTHDNNYFFQPTIALIYVVFVLLFFTARFIDGFYKMSSKEYVANALEIIKEVIIHDMDSVEKKRALSYLKQSESSDPVVKLLRRIIRQTTALPPKEPSFITNTKNAIYKEYKRVTKNKYFAFVVVTFFIGSSIANFFPTLYTTTQNGGFAQWGQFISSCLSLLIVMLGIYFMRRRKKLSAYSLFKSAVLVTILLTQFFLFFKQELTAIFGLIFNLLVYNALQFMIWQEKSKRSYNTLLNSLDGKFLN